MDLIGELLTEIAGGETSARRPADSDGIDEILAARLSCL